MKIVYLILYLWHASGRAGDYAGGIGGLGMTITQMPSLAACEAVGAAAKQIADAQRPEPVAGNRVGEGSYARWVRFESPPAVYRCIEVNK